MTLVSACFLYLSVKSYIDVIDKPSDKAENFVWGTVYLAGCFWFLKPSSYNKFKSTLFKKFKQ